MKGSERAGMPEAETYVFGDFQYVLREDRSAEISDYSGKARNVIVPDRVDGYAVTAIGTRTFSQCLDLAEVILPDTLTSIGEEAFSGCRSLTNIALPPGVTEIGRLAFYGCSGLPAINVPDVVMNLEEGIFMRCRGLKEITLPEGMEYIGEKAFQKCKNLTKLRLPKAQPRHRHRSPAKPRPLNRKTNLPAGSRPPPAA